MFSSRKLTTVLGFTILAVVSGQDFLKTDSPEELFSQFIATHGKTYDSKEAYKRAFTNFKKTLENKKPGFGITQFADMSTEEFRERYLDNTSQASELLINEA
jgi:hypothetical protein